MAVTFAPTPGQMGGALVGPPGFAGDTFGFGMPEAIGDAAAARWPQGMSVEWHDLGGGAWRQLGRAEGELEYECDVLPGEDTADVRIRLTNLGPREWEHSLAFNCFSAMGTSLADHECVRHWVGQAGRPVLLRSLPRHYGPRPTIQLYSVEGAPPAADIPFVAGFDATPRGPVLEGWMAIASHDGTRLVAAASRPALFLFQNMEFSCIHAGQSLGRLAPGQRGEALTRLYFVEAPLGRWYERLRAEMMD
jgi:hypothetical protein